MPNVLVFDGGLDADFARHLEGWKGKWGTSAVKIKQGGQRAVGSARGRVWRACGVGRARCIYIYVDRGEARAIKGRVEAVVVEGRKGYDLTFLWEVRGGEGAGVGGSL